jgi:hypothetical protein
MTAPHSESNRLCHELTNDPPAPRAQGGADGHLAFAAGGAHEQQVGDVGAGDEQQEGHRSEHREQRRTDVAGERTLELLCGPAKVCIRLREILSQPFADRCHVAPRHFGRHARLEPGDGPDEVRAPILRVGHPRLELERHPEVGPGRIGKRRWRNPDDGILVSIERHRPADDVRIGGELRAPELVRQHHDMLRAVRILASDEPAPELHRRVEQVEELRADHCG